MKIEFTKDQFKNLIKLIYLGNWMINAFRTEDIVKEFEDLEGYIYSFAKEAGLDKYAIYDKESKKYYPTSALEEEVDQYIDEYKDETFWEELIYRLGGRDFVEKYGVEAIKKMTWEERIKKEHPFIEKYADEFEKNGIANLVIKNKRST